MRELADRDSAAAAALHRAVAGEAARLRTAWDAERSALAATAASAREDGAWQQRRAAGAAAAAAVAALKGAQEAGDQPRHASGAHGHR